MNKRIFITYRRSDCNEEIAKRIFDNLKNHFPKLVRQELTWLENIDDFSNNSNQFQLIEKLSDLPTPEFDK
jgi:uncharacterized secreted protein with C-terminal beta-propeller domain